MTFKIEPPSNEIRSGCLSSNGAYLIFVNFLFISYNKKKGTDQIEMNLWADQLDRGKIKEAACRLWCELISQKKYKLMRKFFENIKKPSSRDY
jgi:hypothetical protein